MKYFLLSLLLFVSPVRAGVEFDGVDDYIQLSSLSSVTSATVSMWVKLRTATPASGVKTGLSELSTSTSVEHYPFTDGKGYFTQLRSVRVDAVTLSTNVIRTNWHLLTITSDSSTGYRIYQNGELIHSTTQGTLVLGGFTIGKSRGSSAWCDGWISEVQIFNRALSASEIAILASSRTKGPKFSGLIHYWPLDDQPDGTSGDGDTFVDRAGTANATGDDGANNTGLTARAEDYLSYP